jgi:arginyl-tRNA synthetase
MEGRPKYFPFLRLMLTNGSHLMKTKNFDLLTSDIEREIIVNLHSYVTTIRKIASSYEVNILTIYLYNLAKLFHSYYASNKIIDLNNMELTKQRY